MDASANKIAHAITKKLRPGDIFIRCDNCELFQIDSLEDYKPWKVPNWPQYYDKKPSAPNVMKCKDIKYFNYCMLEPLLKYHQSKIKRIWILGYHIGYIDYNYNTFLQLLTDNSNSENNRLLWEEDNLFLNMINLSETKVK